MLTKRGSLNLLFGQRAYKTPLQYTPKEIKELAFDTKGANLDKKAFLDNKAIIFDLKNDIKKLEKELNEKQEKLKSRQLHATFYRREQAQQNIEDAAELIIKHIHKHILWGDLKSTFTLPYSSDEFDVSDFFIQLLNHYHIQTQIYSRDHHSTYLKIDVTNAIAKVSFPMQGDNKKHQEWLDSFDEKLKTSIQSADDQVKKDFAVLFSEVNRFILNRDNRDGSNQLFLKSHPCHGAIKLLDNLVKEKQVWYEKEILKDNSVVIHFNLTQMKVEEENQARFRI